MNQNTYSTLEYVKIKEVLKEFAVSGLGKKMIENLKPSTDIKAIKTMLTETTEAKSILVRSPHVPLQGLHNIEEYITKIERGGILNPSELIKISDFLRGSRKMKKFMKGQEVVAPLLSSYGLSITEFTEIEEEINSSIEGNRVSSKASSNLEKIRKKIDIIEGRIEQKLQSILNSSKYKNYIQDFFISNRNGKLSIPVKAQYKNMIEGVIVDKSATGSTVFIEPAQVSKLNSELNILRADEEAEEYQVLATITGYISMFLKEIKINLEVMTQYDFVFAKAKYSNFIEGREVKINDDDYILIKKGRHPILGKDAVPLDFEIGKDYRTLVITGPNTGGKTVALKTVGLLTLMVQSGLHIPVDEGSEIAIFERIFADIGDGQNIEQSLSTFSSHMKNIIDIINKSRFSTLVLIDEIGTGTDPTEGSALAIAILEELYEIGAISVVTTHYSEIKEYSKKQKGFENGCMEFEPETLKPLYRLTIGKSGKSNALWISEKLGMRDKVLKRAKKYLKGKNVNNSIQKLDIEQQEIKIKKYKNKKSKPKSVEESNFNVGDSVILLDTNKKGVIYKTEDEFGNITILVDDEFITMNKKRVRLFIKKEHLYPEGYDMDTIFVPWKVRKFEKDIKRGALKNPKIFKERYQKIIGDKEEKHNDN